MREKVLRTDGPTGSGRVVAYPLGDGRRLFLIRTYCPDRIGPGPTNLYLIEDEALILVDTGLPTDMAKQFFYFWRRQSIPRGIEALPDDFSERELTSALALTGHRIEEIDDRAEQSDRRKVGGCPRHQVAGVLEGLVKEVIDRELVVPAGDDMHPGRIGILPCIDRSLDKSQLIGLADVIP